MRTIRGDAETPEEVEPTASSVASSSPREPDNTFPTATFADLRDEPVSDATAEAFRKALKEMAEGAGMAAVVITADGTWSGATGKADGVRDVTVDDQFAIASLTKPIVAAQVLQMVEAGELGLDDAPPTTFPRTSTSTRTGRPSATCSASTAASRTTTRRSTTRSREICNIPGRRPSSWRWSEPIALPPVGPSSTRTPTTCCSDS